MSHSFQNEIPKARVNITLDVSTGGALQKKELPFKLLAIGDFSQGKSSGPLDSRERISIDKNNFDAVIETLSPELSIEVPNKIHEGADDLPIHLHFSSMKDFNPDFIAKQVPVLKRLVSMRNLLKDLKSNLLDNKKLRQELEEIFNNNESLENFRQELIPFINQPHQTSNESGE